MKDTLITARRKKIEIFSWLICFVIANLFNLYAIIVYKTSYVELLTSIFYLIIFYCVLYVVWVLIRVAYYGIRRLFRRNRKNVQFKR